MLHINYAIVMPSTDRETIVRGRKSKNVPYFLTAVTAMSSSSLVQRELILAGGSPGRNSSTPASPTLRFIALSCCLFCCTCHNTAAASISLNRAPLSPGKCSTRKTKHGKRSEVHIWIIQESTLSSCQGPSSNKRYNYKDKRDYK